MKLGEKVKILMSQRRFSTRALAAEVRKAGAGTVTHSAIYGLLTHPDRSISFLPELAAVFGMSVDQLLAWTPEGQPHEPVIGWVSPALPKRGFVRIAALVSGGAVDSVDIAASALSRLHAQNTAALRVCMLDDDSMSPELRAGSLCLVDTSADPAASPGIYVLAVNSLLVARRITHTLTGAWAITASNPAFHSLELPESEARTMQILGRVI